MHVCNTESVFLNIIHDVKNFMVYFDYGGRSQYLIDGLQTAVFFSLPKSVSEMFTDRTSVKHHDT